MTRSSPQVDRLDTEVFRIPLDEPESDGTFTWAETTYVVVHATGGGRRGLGWTYAPPACAALVRSLLAPAVIGEDAFDPPRAWREMVVAARNAGRPGAVSAAIAAVDIALWDLKAKLLDVPLCRLLGRSHDSVPVYGSGGFTSLTDKELAAQLGSWVHDDGIPRVKMKIGTAWGSDPARDLRRVALAREAVGGATELYVDANGGYNRKQAVRVGARLSELAVSWFEEPVSSDDLAGLAEVRSLVDAEVAAGEYGYDLAYFARMAPVVDVLQADVTRCGGITEWLRVAAAAAGAGLDISGHCAPALHLHAASAVANLRHVEWFADHVRGDGLLFEGIATPVAGRMAPDLSRPGLGVELKRSDAERFAVNA